MASPTTVTEEKKAVEVKDPATANPLESIKGKWSCPACRQKRMVPIFTDIWTEPKRFVINAEPKLKRKLKEDVITTHHCFNCDYDFAEDEEHREMRESRDKDQADEPWPQALFFLLLMLMTVVMINVFGEDRRSPIVVRNAEQIENSTVR